MFKVNMKTPEYVRTFFLVFLSMTLTIFVYVENSIHVYVYETNPGKTEKQQFLLTLLQMSYIFHQIIILVCKI